MRKLFLFPALFSSFICCHAQMLIVDSTRFVAGNKCCTNIQYAIPTNDNGILFVGDEEHNPGGIIPAFSLDTGYNGNLLVGKIDANHQISWIKVFGGSLEDGARSVCQTPDGGYAIIG